MSIQIAVAEEEEMYVLTPYHLRFILYRKSIVNDFVNTMSYYSLKKGSDWRIIMLSEWILEKGLMDLNSIWERFPFSQLNKRIEMILKWFFVTSSSKRGWKNIQDVCVHGVLMFRTGCPLLYIDLLMLTIWLNKCYCMNLNKLNSNDFSFSSIFR